VRLSTKYYRDNVSSNSEEKLSKRNYLLSHNTTHVLLQLLKAYSRKGSILYVPEFYCGETTNTIFKNWSGKITLYSADPRNPSHGILNVIGKAWEYDIIIVPVLWRLDTALTEIFKQNRVRLIIDAAQYYRFHIVSEHPVLFSDYKYLNLRAGGSCIISNDSYVDFCLGNLKFVSIADFRYLFGYLLRRYNLKKIQEPHTNSTSISRDFNKVKHSKFSLYRYNKAIGQFDFKWCEARLKRNKYLDLLIDNRHLFDNQTHVLFKNMRLQDELALSIPLWFKADGIIDTFIQLCDQYNFEVFYWPDLSVNNDKEAFSSVLCMSIAGKEKSNELKVFKMILNNL
jgi:hypothetical protein